MFERLKGLLAKGEKNPTLGELQQEFVGISIVKLPRVRYWLPEEAEKTGVAVRGRDITLSKTNSYKGKGENCEAYLVSGLKVIQLQISQKEAVLPGELLCFSSPDNTFSEQEIALLYYKVGAVEIGGEVCLPQKWVYQFESKSSDRSGIGF